MRFLRPLRAGLWGVMMAAGLALVGLSGLSTVASVASAASENRVWDIRAWRSPEHLRLVFDLSGQPKYKFFTLSEPDRFVLDLYNTRLSITPDRDIGTDLVRGYRLGKPEKDVTRLVVDLYQPVRAEHQYLPETAGVRPRLVLDLIPQRITGAAAQGHGQPEPARPESTQPSAAARSDVAARAPGQGTPVPVKKELVIVIDAGHGGQDPGALGRTTREKDVVLAISRKLKKKIDATPGMRGVLTRKGDYYLKLRRRIDIAREHQADLFISVHADAFRKRSVRGSSVYALSLTGASSEEAKWLADKENAADLIGGISLSDYDDNTAKTLLDLQMGNSIHESIIFANTVLEELGRLGKVHQRKVGRAAFAVLKSPDIPSILVETAFITNPHEEKLLRSASHQDKLAKAILSGIKRYVKQSHKTVGQ